jgi:hypothetical protein
MADRRRPRAGEVPRLYADALPSHPVLAPGMELVSFNGLCWTANGIMVETSPPTDAMVEALREASRHTETATWQGRPEPPWGEPEPGAAP